MRGTRGRWIAWARLVHALVLASTAFGQPFFDPASSTCGGFACVTIAALVLIAILGFSH